MRSRICRHTAIALFLLLSIACGEQGTEPKTEGPPVNPLLGAWEMLSIEWKSPDTLISIEAAQPGLYLFTPNAYSIMWTRTREARAPFGILSAPSEEEALAAFRSVVFNGGSYVHTYSTLTTTATIAKVPGFEGGVQYYRYEVEGDRLDITMFDETYPDGSKPEWSGIWETRFLMRRVNR